MYTMIASFNVQLFFNIHIAITYIHGAIPFALPSQFPLAPPAISLYSPLYPFPLTWHPPAVTGIVLLRLRLLVNWPYLPHPSPNRPALSNFPEPQLPSAWQRRPWDYSALAMRNTYSLSRRVLVKREMKLVKNDDGWEPIKLTTSPCDSDSGYWLNNVQNSGEISNQSGKKTEEGVGYHTCTHHVTRK
jgi:hypothetical protein